MDIPIIVICYNNWKYIDNTINQIRHLNKDYLNNIIILNNSSTCENTKKYLRNCKYTVIYHPNNGPRINKNNNNHLYKVLPERYIVTDPDLEYNNNLPKNFIEQLVKISDLMCSGRTGFALKIDDFNKMHKEIYFKDKNIFNWESKFWKNKVPNIDYELYEASIDTTFCLITKKYPFTKSIRVAGNFTAKHLPWYIDNNILTNHEDIINVYSNTNNISTISRILLNKIPKVIHQIWIGNKEKPQIFLDSFKNMHQDYEYILWNEDEIKKRNMTFECQDKINEIKELCGKTDIMRYEILYKYGGIYIDADTFCLEKIDDLMTEESFHYENEELNPDLIANGFIIVKPNNSIMKECIERIKIIKDINSHKPFKITGPYLLKNVLYDSNIKFKILPSYTFLPYHHLNKVYLDNGKVYGLHMWGSTKTTEYNYDKNELFIPQIVIEKCKNNYNNNFTRFVNNFIHL